MQEDHDQATEHAARQPLRLAAFLRAQRDDLLAEWEARARAAHPSEALSDEDLRDHLPDLLNAIADVADRASGGRHEVNVPFRDARQHAEHRLALRFDLRRLSEEYALLREVILGRLAPRVGELDYGELVLLNQSLDQAVIESVHTYSQGAMRDLRQEQARLSAVLENMPVAVLIAEAPSGRLTFGNRQIQLALRRPFHPARDVSEYPRAIASKA